MNINPETLAIWLMPVLPAVITAYMLKAQGRKTTFQAFTFGLFIYLFIVVAQLLIIMAENRWGIPFAASMLVLAVIVFLLFRWNMGSGRKG
ncbi:MAG TPA: hypothetical protein VL966_09580 [Alphaproteobacteria bacterium]|nr:hypothetical protein [Alphaproteobacteria bacterium]